MSEKLTERDEYGNADIIGVDTRAFHMSLPFVQFNAFTNALNKLADYEEAELERRMVVLPCKVGTPIFFIRTFCEHANDLGYCNVDLWYARKGYKRESGCSECPNKNLKKRVRESKFSLSLMDAKKVGHLHVSEIYFSKEEAEAARALDDSKGVFDK